MPPEKTSYQFPLEKGKEAPPKEITEYLKQVKSEEEKLKAEILLQKVDEVRNRNLMFTSKKEKFGEVCRYILSKKYKSWQNIELERIIDMLIQDMWLFRLVNEYIIPENKAKQSRKNNNIRQQNTRQQDGLIEKTKEFIGKIWEKIEETGQEIAEWVKKVIEPLKEDFSKKNYEKYGFDKTIVKSAPYEKSPSWSTLCSKTAQRNAQDFWVILERGNAYDASTKLNAHYQEWVDSLVVTNMWQGYERRRVTSSWKDIPIKKLNEQSAEWNFADLYTSSKSEYGHRAIAFRWKDGMRYVLDPYNYGSKDINPKPLEWYLTKVTIKKARLYKAKKYKNHTLTLS